MSPLDFRNLMGRADTAVPSGKRPLNIVLAGVTGAGKTTFASLASGRSDLEIGDGLDPCTQDPVPVTLELDGRPIILIDTPGFDDTLRSDVNILEDLRKWLIKQGFSKGKPLDGMILLYPIFQDIDNTLDRRRIRVLQRILGKNAHRRVVIATTMWGSFQNEMQMEDEIKRIWHEKDGLWGEFRQGGAHLTKHFNTKLSADMILRIIAKACDEEDGSENDIDEELRKKAMLETDAAIKSEIEKILDQDIEFLTRLVLNHRSERPPDSYKKKQEVRGMGNVV